MSLLPTCKRLTIKKNTNLSLRFSGWVVQWLSMVSPWTRKCPGQGTCLGCRAQFPVGSMQVATDQWVSLIINVSIFPSSFHSLKSIKKKNTLKMKQKLKKSHLSRYHLTLLFVLRENKIWYQNETWAFLCETQVLLKRICMAYGICMSYLLTFIIDSTECKSLQI